MSVKVLKGSLETIALLLFLEADEFTTSRVIRDKFNKTIPVTLYKRLVKLEERKLISKKVKGGDFAGDDRTEYKLTQMGLDIRDKLVNYNLKILEHVIEEKIPRRNLVKEEHRGRENSIDFLMEFSEEVSDLVDDHTLIELQKIVGRLIKKFF